MSVVMKSGEVPRYSAKERTTHWITAISFVLVAASGLAFFHPAFYFLSGLLGGGTWARILHPWIGLVMTLGFFVMFFRYWRDNVVQPYDREWRKRLPDIINNRDDNLPEIDKYNIGQKQLFWAWTISMVLLLVSGFLMWHDLIGRSQVTLHRAAAVVHAAAAFVVIMGFIVHVYSAIWWVRGSMRAMTRGTVTHGWAKHHHPLWYRRITGNK